jgi:hypothetical protein
MVAAPRPGFPHSEQEFQSRPRDRIGSGGGDVLQRANYLDSHHTLNLSNPVYENSEQESKLEYSPRVFVQGTLSNVKRFGERDGGRGTSPKFYCTPEP